MAIRSLIAFAVVIGVQALAGCDMPGKPGVAHDDRSFWRKAKVAVQDARLRRQVEAGTFGLAQLYPAGKLIHARDVPPLPRPVAVAIPKIPLRVPEPSVAQAPVQLAFAVTPAQQPEGCVYKPVMSDADMSACN